MKVKFSNGVSSYSGKLDEVVFTSWYQGRLCIVRKYSYPSLGANNSLMGAIIRNLNQIFDQANPLYREDFKTYAKQNGKENLPKANANLHQMPSARALFVKCMWMWHKSDPGHVDLETISLDDIISMESPVCSVVKCVNAGFLKKVRNYANLNHQIDPT